MLKRMVGVAPGTKLVVPGYERSLVPEVYQGEGWSERTRGDSDCKSY